jgi:hypothetical protein
MPASRFLFAIGKVAKPQAGAPSYPPRCRRAAITILHRPLPIRAPIAAINKTGTEVKGMGMTDSQDNAAREREEIIARLAHFKATQEKFEREREEYFVTTLENARHSSERPPFERLPFWP